MLFRYPLKAFGFKDISAGSKIDIASFMAIRFSSAKIIIAGIETMHMIKMGQMNCPDGQTMSAANQFYSLAA